MEITLEYCHTLIFFQIAKETYNSKDSREVLSYMHKTTFNTVSKSFISIVWMYNGLQDNFYNFSVYHFLTFSDVLKSVLVHMRKSFIITI